MLPHVVLIAGSDIDSNDHIRQRSGNNRWTEASISEARLTAWNGDLVGLAACDSAINESIPIRLFYAFNSTSFEEYLWKADEDEWVWQQTWPDYSAAAGVGCHTGVGYNRYVGLVRPSNRLEFWYQPTDDIKAEWQEGWYPLACYFGNQTDQFLQRNMKSQRPSRIITFIHPRTRLSSGKRYKRNVSRRNELARLLYARWQLCLIACKWSFGFIGYSHECHAERELHVDVLSANWPRCHLARASTRRVPLAGENPDSIFRKTPLRCVLAAAGSCG